MKLLPIKLLALAYTATTAIAINDDNKTNNNYNSLLRGSSSLSPLLIANQWDDGCTPDGSLQPYARNGLTMEQICARNYGHTMYPPKHFLVPYKCESGAGYACCVDDLGDTTDQSSVGLGMCTKASSSEDDNSDNNNRSSSNGECKPDGSLNPRSRMQYGVSATEVCLRQATIDGTELTVPYTCTSGAKFACCSTDTSNTMDEPGHGLGKCTKMPPMSNGLPPLDEEKEVVLFVEEEERHPLGCMCMNSRMMPQRGQCCGKCDEGMCPETDVRCQGCDAAESGDSEEGACEVDGSLHPRSRRWTMRSPSKVCEEESTAKGTNFTIPYKCSGPAEGGYPPGVQYACCEEGLGDEMTSLGGKECTKEEDDMSEEEVLVA